MLPQRCGMQWDAAGASQRCPIIWPHPGSFGGLQWPETAWLSLVVPGLGYSRGVTTTPLQCRLNAPKPFDILFAMPRFVRQRLPWF